MDSRLPNLTLVLVCALIGACGRAPAPPQAAAKDPTTERWYGETVHELTEMNRQAKEFVQKGKSDQAAALIQKGEPLSSRLLSVQQPTLAATEAASDLDQLYGEMLFSNRNYGWARLFFQKNLARWKRWKPPTEDTARRLKEAESAITECDRRMSE
jgi:hypothetical protein